MDRIPNFSGHDIKGNEINRTVLKSGFTFIQFTGRDFEADEQLFRIVSSEYGKKMNLVVIEGESIPNPIWHQDESAITIADQNGELRKLFNVPKFGFYIIYNPQGRRLASGLSQTADARGPRVLLRKFIDKSEYRRELLIPKEGHALNEYGWLGPLSLKVHQSSRQYIIISLLASICEGCYGGHAINWLKQLQSAAGDNIEIRCIVTPDFSENDVNNLSSQLELRFPVEVADSMLSQKWGELASLFGPDSVNGTIFLVDRAGHILRILNGMESSGDFLRLCLELSSRGYDEE